MKQSRQTNWRDLTLCDLALLLSKTQSQGKLPSRADQTRICYQRQDQDLGTKDAIFTYS